MIYTVTLNPALDFVIGAENFNLGEVNRSDYENIFVGGKGINVSLVLNELGFESTALGFIAGFTGDKIESELNKSNIKTDFIKLENGNSRINIKIRSKHETDINTTGAEIDEYNLHLLYKKIDSIKDGDVLILSGSAPKGTNSDIYEKLLKRVEGKNLLTVVDATKEFLTKSLKHKPFLIKPNLQELNEIFNVNITDFDDIKRYAKELQNMGARNVLVSMSKDGSMLLCENGDVFRQNAIRGNVLNTSGCGDSMVAGFIAGFLSEHDMEHALSLGCACGSATAFSLGLAKHDDILKLLKRQ